jgi:signal transduction histidine kinase
VEQRAELYRIVQEALANVFRHAGASQASIRLTFGPGELALEIADDGGGIAADGARGRGTTHIRERAASLGGSATVESAAGGGTVVRVTVPLRDDG